jgi:hypothetical protein
VFSEGSCCESGLEDLEEVEEQENEEGGEGKETGYWRDGRDVWWETRAEKKVGRVAVVPSMLNAEVV